MKLIKLLFTVIMCGMHFISMAQGDKPLYSSPSFTVTGSQVVQGKYTARALSGTEMQSDYQSMATEFKSPRITFKFSINGLDNEMLPGVNHEFVCTGADCETPVIPFGSQYKDPQTIPAGTYLKPNTKLKIRLDMRPVFAGFENKGYYTNFNGTKIFKNEFKNVYVVGNTIPMIWNFDNLTYHKELELTDPDGDRIYEVTMIINPKKEETVTLKTWKLSKDISAFAQLETGVLLEKAIYNMSLEEMEKAVETDSTLRTGIDWPGVWTRDVSYSIILSMAYMQPKVSMNSLMRKVNDIGRIIQDTGTGGAWPVSTDRMIWVAAAWEIYKVTGDKAWLRKVYPIIKSSVFDDMLVAFDARTGLMKGESSFLDWREQTYPRWMQPADIFDSKNLATNALHYRALTVASRMAALMNEKPVSDKLQVQAQKIKEGINKHLWIPEKNYYAQYLYGRNYDILSPRAEALGEALCVLFDIAGPERSKHVVRNVPVVEYGIPCIYPQTGDIPPYHNNAVWPFVQSYWMWAGAKAGNEQSVMHSIASIYRAAALFLTNKENFVAGNGDWAGTQINSSNMLWSLSGNISIVHKVLFGMRYNENSLQFEPFVPRNMSSERKLTNFRYRKAILDIEMKGYGNSIASFAIDGKKQEQAVIRADMTGRHSVLIILSDKEPEKQTINLVKNAFTPLMPVATAGKGKLLWQPVDEATTYRIWKNGKVVKDINPTSFDIPAGTNGEYQVMAIGKNGLASFASEPVRVYDSSKVTLLEAEIPVKPSALPYHGFSGKGFVEISKKMNRRISMEFETAADGLYAIDWYYANGNGPTNTENKCAVRTLFVDNKRTGAQVFPQRGIEEWSNWGFSNALKVQLKAGKHSLKLEFMPENENMNVEINQAMLDYVRILKLD